MPRILTAMTFTIVAGWASLAAAQDFKVGHLVVGQPWARASVGPSGAGAAYFTIVNHGKEVDRLVKVETTASKRAALHTHVIKGGVARMRKIAALEVSPGEPTVLKPGGMHIMLMGLKAPLKKGGHFSLDLTFEKAGTVEVQVAVKSITAMGPVGGHKHGGQVQAQPMKGGAMGKVDKRFALAIHGGRLADGPKTVRVKAGETVSLDWTADKATRVHLHGYDIETAIAAGRTAHTRFEARATGRFPVTVHGGHGGHGEKTLLYLEVHPR